ncbi:hypothetical protein [Bacillus suaedae]|uniref:Uncharacterized protein n=1 Tax=Halalkalibacter suaedae TaxID=2822140 RepID=A0A940WPP5_9BACI|nr:hypothetical protein [Bacillus suaedae]MBP3949553.1 hypothetical protein [Bacillus suaedae]
MKSSQRRIERIRSNYVDQVINSTTRPIEPIERIQGATNQTQHPTENHLLSYQLYYQSVEELKQEFRRFYHQEKDLNQAMALLNKNETLLTQTNQLIIKYNQAVTTLRDFDQIAGTQHVKRIRDLFEEYRFDFKDIGITTTENQLLKLDPTQFVSYLSSSEDTAANLISRFKKLILKEYYTLSKIKPSHSEKFDVYEPQPQLGKGVMIEEQC